MIQFLFCFLLNGLKCIISAPTVVLKLWILFQMYLLLIIEPFLFENVGQLLKCIFCCITACKVKNQNMSQDAIGRGSQNFRKSLNF